MIWDLVAIFVMIILLMVTLRLSGQKTTIMFH